jgi:hypothetical protein
MPTVDQVLEQLRPHLAGLEAERRDLGSRTRRFLLGVAALGVLGFVLLRLLLDGESAGLAILTPIGAVVLGAWQLLRRQDRWEQRVLGVAVPVICDVLGNLRYQPSVEPKAFLPAFEKLGVVGTSNKRSLRHHFRGRYRGAGFELADAALRRGGGGKNSSATTVFQGLLFRIQWPVSVDQRLLISPRVGIKLLNKRADMSEVLLNDPAFDEKFVVHHDLDQHSGADLARRVLTPGFRSGLLELNRQEARKAYDMGGLVVGLMYDSLYVARSAFQKAGAVGKVQIEKPRPFLAVRFFLSGDSGLEERVGAMVHDVTTVYRIIDRLYPRPATQDAP